MEEEGEGEAEVPAVSGSSLVPRLCGGACGVSVWGGEEGGEEGGEREGRKEGRGRGGRGRVGIRTIRLQVHILYLLNLPNSSQSPLQSTRMRMRISRTRQFHIHSP